MNDADTVKLAYEIAGMWDRQRRDIRVVAFMETPLREKLEALEVKTRGDQRRCICLAPHAHDLQCPAFNP